MLNIQGMPMKRETPGLVDDGAVDSMLWAGLMCASGDLSSAPGIKNCQTADGRLWRSPKHIGVEEVNSFSRDMLLGFLLYVAVTNDRAILFRWIVYISQHGRMCPKASDNRCYATAPIRWQISRLITEKTNWLLKPYLVTTALTSPLGYQLHLIGVHLLLDWLLTKKRGTLAGKILHYRQPLNPFFQWLANKPVILPEQQTGNESQWAWEREDKEEAWKNSMGWDYLFIKNLINQNP